MLGPAALASWRGKGRSSAAVGVDEATPRIGCEQNCSKERGLMGGRHVASRHFPNGRPPALAVVTPR